MPQFGLKVSAVINIAGSRPRVYKRAQDDAQWRRCLGAENLLVSYRTLACLGGKSGKFEAASARIHHLGSPSSALVLSVHS